MVASSSLFAMGQDGAAVKSVEKSAAAEESSTTALPAHPISEAQVHKLVDITHARDLFRQNIKTSIELQKKNLPPVFPPEFWSEVEAEFDKIDVYALALPTYRRYLSTEDAEKIIAFYETPAGQSSIRAMPAMYTELQQKGFELGKEIGQRTAEKYKTQIEENVKKLQQQKSGEPGADTDAKPAAKPAPQK